MSEENKNPFTIGAPFTIQFEESGETSSEETPTETEESTVEEPKQDTQPAAKGAASAPETSEEVEDKPIEIEDILDKPVAFEDATEETSTKKEEQAKDAISEALSTSDSDFDYEHVAAKLIESGFWEDFEGRESTEINKEVFEQLSKQQDKWKKENLATTLFSSLDPVEKEFLAFKQQGGDLHTYYQSRTQVDRINNLNLDSDQGKLNSIYTYYKNFVGWDDAKIQKHLSRISGSPEDLEEEAMSSYEKIPATNGSGPLQTERQLAVGWRPCRPTPLTRVSVFSWQEMSDQRERTKSPERQLRFGWRPCRPAASHR